MVQNNINSVTGSSYFLQEHSPVIRIWHWLTYISISVLILTVLLNSTLMNQRRNIVIVQDQLKSKGVTVSEEQAFAVSREYEDKIWGIHKWLGYGLAFLLFSRILIELFQPAEEKVISRIKKASGLYKNNGANKQEHSHYLLVKLGYFLFYILLFCMVITGLSLAFGRELGFSRGLRGVFREIHSIGQYFIYAFVFIHLCGVIIADNRKDKGLVSGMISGNR